MKPIAERVTHPSPSEVRQARENAGLTQSQAAELVSAAKTAAYKTWAGYETPEGQGNHRLIPLSTWELFLLLTNQHPTLKLIRKTIKPASPRANPGATFRLTKRTWSF